MNVTDTAILAWHGSRNPAGRRLIERITRRVAGLLPRVTTQIAWVDVEPVLLAQTLATAGDCTVVPCFLTAGYHVSHDIPDAVASAPGEVRVTPHLGGSLDRALMARVAEAGGDQLTVRVVHFDGTATDHRQRRIGAANVQQHVAPSSVDDLDLACRVFQQCPAQGVEGRVRLEEVDDLGQFRRVAHAGPSAAA